MVITLEQRKGIQVLKFKSDLVLANVDEVKYELLNIMKQVKDIWIDLSEVKACDTSGVQLLYAFYVNMTGQGRTFKMQGDSTSVKKAFARLGLSIKLFEK